jgi:hypothetical protein
MGSNYFLLLLGHSKLSEPSDYSLYRFIFIIIPILPLWNSEKNTPVESDISDLSVSALAPCIRLKPQIGTHAIRTVSEGGRLTNGSYYFLAMSDLAMARGLARV